MPGHRSVWVSNSVLPPVKTRCNSGTFSYLRRGQKPSKMRPTSHTQSQTYNFRESKNSRKSSESVQSHKNISYAHSTGKSPRSMPLYQLKRCSLSDGRDDYKYTSFIRVQGHFVWDSACHVGRIISEHALCTSFCSGLPEASAACSQVS